MNQDIPVYQSAILFRARDPQFRRRLRKARFRAECRNPLCGDHVMVELELSNGGVIDDAAFSGEGCAIMTAAADLMIEAVRGMADVEARAAASAFEAMVRGGPEIDAEYATYFAALRGYPARQRCATLPWEALMLALEEAPT